MGAECMEILEEFSLKGMDAEITRGSFVNDWATMALIIILPRSPLYLFIELYPFIMWWVREYVIVLGGRELS